MLQIKSFIKTILIAVRLYPSIYFYSNPFKLFEFNHITKKSKIGKNETILDIGCGDGLQSVLIAKKCRKFIGIDTSLKSIEQAKRLVKSVGMSNHCQFRCVGIEKAKFLENSFDKIFSICVIEHVPEYKALLSKAYHVLKKNGQFLLSVDSLASIEDEIIKKKHQKDHYAVKYFTVDELRKLLNEIGFQEVIVYPIFRSEFARKLFIKGIKNRFRFNHILTIFYYLLLLFNEKLTNQRRGIFLVACCKK